MATQNQLTYSGNLITVELDGKVVGLIQSLRASDNFGLEAASGIGDIHNVEYVPSRADHSLSIQNMTLFVGNLRDVLGQLNENGDAVMQGWVCNIVIYRRQPYAQGQGPTVNTAGLAGAALRTYVGCSWDSGDVDITAHRITMQTGQFKALDCIGLGI